MWHLFVRGYRTAIWVDPDDDGDDELVRDMRRRLMIFPGLQDVREWPRRARPSSSRPRRRTV